MNPQASPPPAASVSINADTLMNPLAHLAEGVPTSASLTIIYQFAHPAPASPSTITATFMNPLAHLAPASMSVTTSFAINPLAHPFTATTASAVNPLAHAAAAIATTDASINPLSHPTPTTTTADTSINAAMAHTIPATVHDTATSASAINLLAHATTDTSVNPLSHPTPDAATTITDTSMNPIAHPTPATVHAGATAASGINPLANDAAVIAECSLDYPNGRVSKVVPIVDGFSNMESRSVCWALVLNYSNTNSRKEKSHRKGCLGNYECPISGCLSAERPRIPEQRFIGVLPMETNTRCIVHGVALIHVPCKAYMKFRESGQHIIIDHFGEHSHRRPHPIRETINCRQLLNMDTKIDSEALIKR